MNIDGVPAQIAADQPSSEPRRAKGRWLLPTQSPSPTSQPQWRIVATPAILGDSDPPFDVVRLSANIFRRDLDKRPSCQRDEAPNLMTRPYRSLSIDDLEKLFETAQADSSVLNDMLSELLNRSTPRAVQLRTKVLDVMKSSASRRSEAILDPVPAIKLDKNVRFGRERIDDRMVSELIGLAHGILADGQITIAEVEYLKKWLASKVVVTNNPVLSRIERELSRLGDRPNDLSSIKATLDALVGGEFEFGESTKSTKLPLCDPAPEMVLRGAEVCFTGTFAFGKRKDCEEASRKAGAVPGELTNRTRYLIVGEYATDSWMHSAFGRKIEKAVEMRDSGLPIHIVSETLWVQSLQRVR